jgi:hypothetical protein
MNCPDTFCSGRLRLQKHVFDPNWLRPCIYIYIYIKKKMASFGSNEMLKNKERPWTMFQWHTCPSNRVMRQNRTMWQTQKKPTIGDVFYHLLYLYSYWGWFIAGFTTVPHYFQHTHTYIYI